MNVHYEEKAGAATFAAGEIKLAFGARRLWLRHIGGTGVAEVSIGEDYATTHVKLEELSAGLQQTHPHEVLIEASEGRGISKLAVLGSGLTVAVRATS